MYRTLVVSGSDGSFGRDGTAWQLRRTALPEPCGPNWNVACRDHGQRHRPDVGAGARRHDAAEPAADAVDSPICCLSSPISAARGSAHVQSCASGAAWGQRLPRIDDLVHHPPGGNADRASLLNPVPVFGPEPGLNEVFRATPAEAIKRTASGR